MEDDGDFASNHTDFGARLYNSAIRRWNAKGALSHKYPSISSYTFSLSNPIKFVDHDGRVVRDENGNIIYTVEQS